MKRNLLVLSLLAAGTLFGSISVGISIGPPPPARVYVVPASRGPGYVWVDGYWYPVAGRYAWHEGYWTRPPYAGAYWVNPGYRGRRYYEGYWNGRRGRVEHNHDWDHRRDRDYRRDRR